MMNLTLSPWVRRGAILVIIILAAIFTWSSLKPDNQPRGIASGNGRIEAVEIDISARAPARIRDVLASEGELVEEGQILVQMDIDSLNAQRAEAQAQLARAINGVEIARSNVLQAQSELKAAQAIVRQRQAELSAGQKRLVRSEELSKKGAASLQERDDDEARVASARAALSAARAQVAAVQAGIKSAESQIIGSESSVEAARATVRRLDVEIADSSLKAPRAGRIQYIIAYPGEIVGAGGKVLNLVDLSDVHMSFFLPETVVGRVPLGADVKIVLDAVPGYAIPAKVSYVADVAQFTPKTVETESERQKLMFRVKAKIDPALLKEHIHQVKTGLPGMAYVQLNPETPWPEELELKSP